MRWTGAAVGAVACLLAPTATWAQIDNSAIECGIGPTYFPRGDHWPMTPPASSNPVLIRHQQAGAPNIGTPITQKVINEAFATWTRTACPGNVPPNVVIEDGFFTFNADYLTRDRGDRYECVGGGQCPCALGCNLTSWTNVIYFVCKQDPTNAAWCPNASTVRWSQIADSQTLALTTNLFIPDTGYTITSDMEFNAENYQWRARACGTTTDPCTSACGGACVSRGCSLSGASASTCYDIFTVAQHEVGHFLGFNHVQCADSVMFPQVTNTQVRASLSAHETTGLCTIYKPRDAARTGNVTCGATMVSARDTGEQCQCNAQCPVGNTCIKPAGHVAASPWGWCGRTCTSNSFCGAGFICVPDPNNGSVKFCKPGVNNTGQTGNPTNPGTGTSLDLCAACTAGEQCASGVCVGDGDGDGAGASLCTLTCTAQVGDTPTGGCPSGMSCRPTNTGASVCWPTQGSSCGSGTDFRAGLNQTCYTGATEQFTPCGPDLICFGFAPRCGAGQDGVCMLYCNPTQPCRDGNLTCCYGVDDNGNCVRTPSDALPHGGCFDIRQPGESCVIGEQSVCQSDSGCFFFVEEGVQRARCYRRCAAASCTTDETCVTFEERYPNNTVCTTHAICCDSDKLPNTCSPTDEVLYYGIGVECTSSAECDSGICQHLDGESACSRWCNWTTEFGCPTDLDITGDGTPDPFVCRFVSGEGRCWPVNGPVPPPSEDAVAPPEGCCAAVTAKPGDLLLAMLLWLPFWWRTRRLRRA